MYHSIAYVNDPDRIEDIDDVIHDCFFDVDGISFEPATSVLSIRFRREALDKSRVLKRGWLLKKWEIPVAECLLKFNHVESYKIEDTEQVGRYNLMDLEYDPQRRRILVNTGVPIHIEIFVAKFEIEVEETDKIVEVRTIRTPFNIKEL
jgi:hypothetical protein